MEEIKKVFFLGLESEIEMSHLTEAEMKKRKEDILDYEDLLETVDDVDIE